MRYCNVKMPIEMARMDEADNVRRLLVALVGPVDDWSDATTGCSPHGPYEEGNVMFGYNSMWWSLAYDYMDLGDSTARVFRIAIDRQPERDKQ